MRRIYQYLISITAAALVAVSAMVPTSAARVELADDCTSYSKVFEKTGADGRGVWECNADGTNRFNPHPQLNKPVFGKKDAYRGRLVYKQDGITSFEIVTYCAEGEQDGARKMYVWPSFQYPPDNPTVFGLVVEVSNDNKTWVQVEYTEKEGSAITQINSDKVRWITYTVKSKPMSASYKYIRISNAYDVPWAFFIGGVKIVSDPSELVSASSKPSDASSSPGKSSNPTVTSTAPSQGGSTAQDSSHNIGGDSEDVSYGPSSITDSSDESKALTQSSENSGESSNGEKNDGSFVGILIVGVALVLGTAGSLIYWLIIRKRSNQ